MNVFFLDKDPVIAARLHCDVHVRKMIIEYAQMLCTAHRMIDGQLKYVTIPNKNKKLPERSTKLYTLNSDIIIGNVLQDRKFYIQTHINHPSAIWTRTNTANYEWVYQCFLELCHIFERTYNKKHLTSIKLVDLLELPPKNLQYSDILSKIPLAANKEQYALIHHQYNNGIVSSVQAYRWYMKSKLFEWMSRDKPMKYTWPCLNLFNYSK